MKPCWGSCTIFKTRAFLLALAILVGGCGCSSMLYYPSNEMYMPPEKMKESPDDIHFKNEDGKTLHGWYFHNKPSPKKPRAVLVFFHGNAQNISSHYMHLLWILKEGFDFFIFDYQGYGSSEGSPSPSGTVKDGKAAMYWVKENHPDVPIVVFAQSLGGAVGLRVAGELADKIPMRLVVADSTFYSYKVVARRVLSRHWLTWLFQPFTYIVLSDTYAPEDYIEKISPTPLLVIHGDKDQVVDFELGEKVFAFAKEPKEFWRIPDGLHTDVFWHKDDIYRKKFLEKLKSVGL